MATLVVETGEGIWEANAYAGLAFVHTYLHARGKNTAWDAATASVRAEAIVKATDYIDRRFGARFLGFRERRDLVVAAYNFVTIIGNASNNDTLTVGSITYRFRSTLQNAYDVLIGADAAGTTANLIAAINASGTAGVEYFAGTLAHPDVSATLADGSSVILRSKTAGAASSGTVPTTSSASARISVDYPTLINGSDSAEQLLEWPRRGVYTRNGVEVRGIPEKLRQATAEYALRALTQDLMPDPALDATGKAVVSKREKLGPIEEETTYAQGGQITYKLRPYPEADRLLQEYVGDAGGVYR